MIPGGIPDTMQNSVHLQYPDAAAIEAAYRELPKKGTVYLSCGSAELATVLQQLEAVGFHGLQINTQGLAARHLEVRAFKGKQGPCYETGRSASYRGVAAAVLDDDNHLVVGTVRVCEKTGALYAAEPYDQLMEVSDPDPALMDQMMIAPQPFDCDTLEEDARRLRDEVGEPDTGERRAVLYPGPFKALVLRDGTILRRGQATTVPATQVGELVKTDGAVKLAADDARVADPEFFQAAYDDRGAACLLGELPLADTFSADVRSDFAALGSISDDMAARLKHLIDRGDKQFVLTGSDPRVQYGCCPSDEVFHANRLAEAGILDLYRAPAPPGTCPTTIYAFHGELHSVDGKPDVQIDQAFRSQVRAHLQAGPSAAGSGGSSVIATVTRWGLLLLVAAAVVVGLLNRQEDNGLPYGFEPPPEGAKLVVAMYHPHKRCEPCLAIQRLGRQVVEEDFRAQYEDGLITYRVIDYEREGRTAAETLGLWNSSIALLPFADGELTQPPVLPEWVWEHATLDDEAAWRSRLIDEIAVVFGARPEPGG